MEKKFLITSKKINVNNKDCVSIISKYPNLLYTNKIGDGGYFNASFFYNSEIEHDSKEQLDNNPKPAHIIAKEFIDKMSFTINRMVDMYNISTKDTFIIDQNKNLWIASNLDTTFLCFCFPDLITECMDWARSMLRFNFAVSDSVLNSIVGSTMPTESLMEILKNRENET